MRRTPITIQFQFSYSYKSFSIIYLILKLFLIPKNNKKIKIRLNTACIGSIKLSNNNILLCSLSFGIQLLDRGSNDLSGADRSCNFHRDHYSNLEATTYLKNLVIFMIF